MEEVVGRGGVVGPGIVCNQILSVPAVSLVPVKLIT